MKKAPTAAPQASHTQPGTGFFAGAW